jgi:hypothetical protein
MRSIDWESLEGPNQDHSHLVLLSCLREANNTEPLEGRGVVTAAGGMLSSLLTFSEYFHPEKIR